MPWSSDPAPGSTGVLDTAVSTSALTAFGVYVRVYRSGGLYPSPHALQLLGGVFRATPGVSELTVLSDENDVEITCRLDAGSATYAYLAVGLALEAGLAWLRGGVTLDAKILEVP